MILHMLLQHSWMVKSLDLLDIKRLSVCVHRRVYEIRELEGKWLSNCKNTLHRIACQATRMGILIFYPQATLNLIE
jgi:hypothetical protein